MGTIKYRAADDDTGRFSLALLLALFFRPYERGSIQLAQSGRGLIDDSVELSARQQRDNGKRDTLRSLQRIVASDCRVLYAQNGVKATTGLSWGAYVQRVGLSNRDDLGRATRRDMTAS